MLSGGQFELLPPSMATPAVFAVAAGSVAAWVAAHWPLRWLRSLRPGAAVHGTAFVGLVLLGTSALMVVSQAAGRALVLATNWPL
ncbi:MAG TPA: hypothetical protein VM098_10235, partial [Phycisphaerae bacterium]|nr:hypothetical protein [Phycisphaerae bacterium]